MANIPSDTLTINTALNQDDMIGGLSLGWDFTVSASTNISALRFYGVAAMTGCWMVIWSGASHTELVRSGTKAVAVGWNSFPVTATLVPGVSYTVGIYIPQSGNAKGSYTATVGLASRTMGSVVTPTQSGRFNYTATAASSWPNTANSFSYNTWYGIDMVTAAAEQHGASVVSVTLGSPIVSAVGKKRGSSTPSTSLPGVPTISSTSAKRGASAAEIDLSDPASSLASVKHGASVEQVEAMHIFGDVDSVKHGASVEQIQPDGSPAVSAVAAKHGGDVGEIQPIVPAVSGTAAKHGVSVAQLAPVDAAPAAVSAKHGASAVQLVPGVPQLSSTTMKHAAGNEQVSLSAIGVSSQSGAGTEHGASVVTLVLDPVVLSTVSAKHAATVSTVIVDNPTLSSTTMKRGVSEGSAAIGAPPLIGIVAKHGTGEEHLQIPGLSLSGRGARHGATIGELQMVMVQLSGQSGPHVDPPVEPEQLSLAQYAWRYVVAAGVLPALLEAGLGYDEPDGPYASGWLFAAEVDDKPFRDPEGTGKCAVVLHSYDDWTAPAMFRSTRYPRLRLAVYADPTRDESGAQIQADAVSKVGAIRKILNPLFHDSGNQVRHFDTLRVISTVQSSGWSIMPVPQGDGLVRGDCIYDLQLD